MREARMQVGRRPRFAATALRAELLCLALVCILALGAGCQAAWLAGGAAQVAANDRWSERNQSAALIAVGASSLARLEAPPGGQVPALRPPDVEPWNESRVDKLDYIMEFMRLNKLTRFYELLGAPEMRALRARLNQLERFTLFLPTDEAMLQAQAQAQTGAEHWPSGQRERFILGHAAGQLLAQRSELSPADQAPGVVSLAGNELHLTAQRAPANRSAAPPTVEQASSAAVTVNGATILGGHSYALQEKANESATYAIVHLLDRPIYPAPELSLLGLLRRWAPRMARYFERAELQGELERAARQRTLFAPTDDAFRAAPAKLLQQLDANRTALVRFLLGHLLEGAHYAAQLGADAVAGRKRDSLAQREQLEFGLNPLRSRSVLLAGSVPVLEADLLASNGVLHLLARPLFEAQILSECQCSAAAGSRAAPTLDGDESAAAAAAAGHNELERDESGLVRSDTPPRETAPTRAAQSAARRARSGGLVERNNLDFYRPSTAPAESPFMGALLRSTSAPLPAGQQTLPAAELRQPDGSLPMLAPEAGVVGPKYHQIVNATTRQRMRLTGSGRPINQQAAAGHGAQQPTPGQRFVYDRPLAEPAAPGAADKSAPAPPINASLEQLAALATDRRQRLLKFQPEEAVPPTPGGQPAPDAAAAKQPAALHPDLHLSGKTAAPAHLPACAFYDTECRRLNSRLVRLPETRPRPGGAGLSQAPAAHLDSTFGETLGDIWPAATPPMAHATVPPFQERAPPTGGGRPATGSKAQLQRFTEAAIFVSPTPIGQLRPAFFGFRKSALQQNLTATPAWPEALKEPVFIDWPGDSARRETTQRPAVAVAVAAAAAAAAATSKRVPLRSDQQFPIAPAAHVRQKLQQQQLVDTNGTSRETGAEKLGARKLLRPPVAQQPQVQVQVELAEDEPATKQAQAGDISVTSARLSSSAPLATLASSQALEQVGGPGQTQTEFFQDRSIAEIMDNSGLRIDGQQVTFERLKECLTEANLLSLVRQTGGSLTIFMPTDAAFQRLVLEQLVHQQGQRAAASGSARQPASARLSETNLHQSLPLVARRGRTAWSAPSSAASSEADAALLPVAGAELAGSEAAARLTLDCASSQVRQLLLDHLSSKPVSPKQLQRDLSIVSLAGHQLLLSSVPSKKIVVVDGQPVVAATRAQNGMVYVLNKFLNLTQQAANVVQLLETQQNLTTFLSYLAFSGLSERLKQEAGPLTVLAPTNEAFEQLSSSARQLINSDPSALMEILRGHIVEGAQYGKLISMRSQLRTLNPEQVIEARVNKPNLYLLDNQLTSMRLVGTAGNGVVNSIDRLIVPAWLRARMGAKPTSTAKPLLFSSSRLTQQSGSGASNLALANDGRPTQFERTHLPRTSSGNSFQFSNQQQQQQQQAHLLHDLARLSALPQAGEQPASGGQLVGQQTEPPLDRRGRTSGNMELIEKLAAMMEASRFVRYMQKSRVAQSLRPAMNYVVLMPTDQAFDRLPKQIAQMLEKDVDRLDDLISYHVLDTTFDYINTIPDGSTLNTLNEKDILFNWHRNNTVLTASGAVVMGGIQEDNIAILIVDRVLYPTPGNILQIISKSPILSNFTSLVRSTNLENQLTLAGPFTLFAPSDFAFNQLDQRDLDFLRSNKDAARRFLLRHLSQPSIFTSSVALSANSGAGTKRAGSFTAGAPLQQTPAVSISNSLGEELLLRQRNDYFSVNDVNFSYADVAATNGVIHVIDGLL